MRPNFEQLAKPFINGGLLGTLTYGRTLRSHFGVSPGICLQIWHLQEDAHSELMEYKPKHLLWALFYLNYPTEDMGASRWNVSQKHFASGYMAHNQPYLTTLTGMLFDKNKFSIFVFITLS